MLLTTLAALPLADAGAAPLQRGLCWGHGKTALYNHLSNYSGDDARASLRQLAATHATHVQIETAWYVDQCSSTVLHPMPYTPSNASLVGAIRYARSLGLRVMLNAHIEVACVYDASCEPGCGGRTDIDFGGNSSAWDAWFASYTDYIRQGAQLCELAGCELMAAHVELQEIGAALPDIGRRWAGVIGAARQLFGGKLTASVNGGPGITGGAPPPPPAARREPRPREPREAASSSAAIGRRTRE